jgi:hypothetical protein
VAYKLPQASLFVSQKTSLPEIIQYLMHRARSFRTRLGDSLSVKGRCELSEGRFRCKKRKMLINQHLRFPRPKPPLSKLIFAIVRLRGARFMLWLVRTMKLRRRQRRGGDSQKDRAMKTPTENTDERERAQTRRVLIGLILVAVVVLGLLAYDWFFP